MTVGQELWWKWNYLHDILTPWRNSRFVLPFIVTIGSGSHRLPRRLWFDESWCFTFEPGSDSSEILTLPVCLLKSYVLRMSNGFSLWFIHSVIRIELILWPMERSDQILESACSVITWPKHREWISQPWIMSPYFFLPQRYTSTLPLHLVSSFAVSIPINFAHYYQSKVPIRAIRFSSARCTLTSQLW